MSCGGGGVLELVRWGLSWRFAGLEWVLGFWFGCIICWYEVCFVCLIWGLVFVGYTICFLGF